MMVILNDLFFQFNDLDLISSWASFERFATLASNSSFWNMFRAFTCCNKKHSNVNGKKTHTRDSPFARWCMVGWQDTERKCFLLRLENARLPQPWIPWLLASSVQRIVGFRMWPVSRSRRNRPVTYSSESSCSKTLIFGFLSRGISLIIQ